ncbi:Ras family protein [Besnoitia besnoiti]|uniref:Ras family protein n=1 Tax=Besnoitia besnoiti TaxID=94643 RepID=A0A2A9MM38_BESBE|nr:Ras family protein [Besnoitia besnoiti]PFH36797.1 Ras family protein [Besnoitia besnoiti]
MLAFTPITRQPVDPVPQPSKPIRVAVVGDVGVGKTTLLQCFVNGTDPTRREGLGVEAGPTIGVDYLRKTIRIKNENVCLHFWNLSGDAVFGEMRKEFYKESDAVVLVFDVTSRASYKNLSSWLSVLQPLLDDHRFSLFLCGNKAESASRVVEESEGRLWALKNGLPYFEVSSTTGQGVDTLFENLVLSMHLLSS